MELSEIKVKRKDSEKFNKTNCYENVVFRSKRHDELNKQGETHKDESIYEQLRLDNKTVKTKEDKLNKRKCVTYILSAMIIVLYIAVIVLIIFVAKTRSPDPVDGKWTYWSEWTSCDVTCGNGTQIRTRACANPSPSFGGAYCVGEIIQNDICMKETCSVDGKWTNWSDWTACFVTCGNGTQIRTRACANPSPSLGGANCVGESIQNNRCINNMCPVTDGGWGNWGSWSTCSATCGESGTKSRSRSCTNPKPSDLGEYCDGDPFQLQQCSLSKCSVTDGGWTNWGSWSSCSFTCGVGGTKARSRSCTNPKPSDLGDYCKGDSFQLLQCILSTCASKMSAFSVSHPYSYESIDGVPKLNFSHLIYQDGTNFNQSSGTFKCSIPGTYHFSVTLVKKRSSSRVDMVSCYLYKSGRSLIVIRVDPTDDDTDKGNAAISQSVVIHLNVSDTVYLGSCSSPPSTYMEYWSSFTGFLLYPDN